MTGAPIRSVTSSWRGDAEALGALGVAAGCFAATFRGPKDAFWKRMTATGAVLGATAVLRQPRLLQMRPRPRHLAEGAGIAAGLYTIFRVGDVVARRVMPSGAGDIDAIYDLRAGKSRWAIGARLAAVIGPAEEAFWRGYLQELFSRQRKRQTGAALATAAYAAVHVASLNPTLVGAAGVAGAYWSALAAAGVDMESLVLSHVLWDVVIFLVAPTVRSAAV